MRAITEKTNETGVRLWTGFLDSSKRGKEGSESVAGLLANQLLPG
jgi:hypothetical protein